MEQPGNEIADAVSEKIGKSFMAIFIFVFVGMIIEPDYQNNSYVDLLWYRSS